MDYCGPWNSPGQNTVVDSLPLLQGIFPTQGSNPGLLHCRQILYQLSHKGSLKWEFQSVQFSHSVVSDSLWPRGLHPARLPCPSPTPGTCANSCTLGQWCHLTISSSVISLSCPHSFPASLSLPVSQFFISGGQSQLTGAQLQHQFFQWIFRTELL